MLNKYNYYNPNYDKYKYINVEDTDIHISISKTECIHVKSQDEMSVSRTETMTQEKFCCPHIGCSDVFNNVHGMKIHVDKCRHKGVYLIEKIVGISGDPGVPGVKLGKFKVRWQGYGEEDDTWEPWSHLSPTLIQEYLLTNSLHDHQWEGARYTYSECDKQYRNERGVKNHKRHCYHNHSTNKTLKGGKMRGQPTLRS